MRVLGIDPGIAITGFGVLDVDTSVLQPSVVTFGSIETPAGLHDSDRLHEVYRDLNQVLEAYSPDVVACEKLFVQRNVSSVMSVSQARGVILLAVRQQDLPVYEYTPSQIKLALTGYGRADKGQVQRMIMTLLGLDVCPTPDDVADALAVACCHAHVSGGVAP